MNNASTRFNLLIPMDIAILVEKEADKRGMKATQLMKEAISEKVRKNDAQDKESDVLFIKQEIVEMKKILFLLLDALQSKTRSSA